MRLLAAPISRIVHESSVRLLLHLCQLHRRTVVSGTLRALFRAHALNGMLTRIAEPTMGTAAESECEDFLNDIVNGEVTPLRNDPAFAGKGNRIGADGKGNADSVAATSNTLVSRKSLSFGTRPAPLRSANTSRSPAEHCCWEPPSRDHTCQAPSPVRKHHRHWMR